MGFFLSWGTLGRGQVCEGERHSELRSPFFPLALPLSGHVAVLRCGMLQCVGKCLYAAVLAMYSCADGIHRTEGGLHSRPVPGNCYIAGAHLLLSVVVFLVLICSCLLMHCWCLPASACWHITGIDLLLPKTGNRPAARAAFPSGGTKKSAQPDTANTAAYRTKPIN